MAATGWLAQHATQNREEAGAASADYLRLMGTVLIGYIWARMARIEGVADTEPYNPEDRMDDRNRRISITMKRK